MTLPAILPFPLGASGVVPTLPLPGSGTVLSLSGLNFNLYNHMPAALQSLLSTAPYTMTKVNYPASLSPKSISTGVANFDRAVRARPGVQKIGFGMSQGAQVLSAWMRLYKDDVTAPPPSELMFVLIGNPLRSTGGYIIGRYEVGGTIGQPTPTDTPWSILDVARRYDGFADWVTDETNDIAVQNANSGKNTYHTHYENVDVYAPTNLVWTVGNTTYVLTDESPPYFKSLQGDLSEELKASLTADIELGYDNRPAVSAPVVEPVAVVPLLGWWALLRKFLFPNAQI